MNPTEPIRPLARRVPTWKVLKRALITPLAKNEGMRNREVVLNVLLLATVAILALAVLLLIISYAVIHNTYVLGRIFSVGLVLAGAMGLFQLSRTRHVRLSASLLVGLYFAIATTLVYQWGVDLPIGILLYALITALAGILLGARYSLYAAAGAVAVLIIVAIAGTNGTIHPDRHWVTQTSYGGDIIGFSLVLIVLAVVCWLFNYQMERSLQRALHAEAALKRQKALLEETVAKRTSELKATQADKLQQMYRFAEVGQMGVALLHELANHLTTLHLDIEDLEEQNRSGIIKRAKRTIRYIDSMVHQVREQLDGKSGVAVFSVAAELNKVIDVHRHKAQKAGVAFEWKPKLFKDITFEGDPTRFRQVAAIIISNAIDAYDTPTKSKQATPKVVAVNVVSTPGTLSIIVTDWGKGIKAGKRSAIFEPFYGTKKTGMGLGLFIAKQITEDYFGGTVAVSSTGGSTVFTLTFTRK